MTKLGIKLIMLAASAAFILGAVLPVHAAGYYVIEPATEARGVSLISTPTRLIATAGQAGDITSNMLQNTLSAVLESGDWSSIINYTGQELTVNSMAGGIEPLSVYNIAFAGNNAAALSTAGQATVTLSLKEVLNGRTLRRGERIQGFYCNGADGLYYATSTRVSSGKVKYEAPYFPGITSGKVLFFVARDTWSAGDGYDYLAIGNSITMHPRRSFWPNAMGMGASSIDKDYYHILASGLTRNHKNVNSIAMNYSIWEILPGSRELALNILDPYLSDKLDLVTIQVGENVIANPGDFAGDYVTLISYIKAKAPNAQIVLVGTFWKDDNVEMIKKTVASQLGCDYVSLEQIQDNPKYLFGNGKAKDSYGNEMTSDNPGTAIHPNDAAMKYIADSILKVVK